MKQKIINLVASLSLLIPVAANAWNAMGHMVIAKIAYDNLTPAARNKVDKIVRDLERENPTVHSFTEMAIWPDQLVSQQIGLFSHWHYIDIAFSDDGTALKDIKDTDNAAWAITQLQPVVRSEQVNAFERARALAFLTHVVGDIHQPLHTVSRISAAHPDGDLGGNLYAVLNPTQNFPAKSATNLHAIWDAGLGVFSGAANDTSVTALANRLEAQYPHAYFSHQASDLNQDEWVNEGVTYCKTFLYSTPENQQPNSAYVAKGKEIAEQRAVLAGYRLAGVLNKLL